ADHPNRAGLRTCAKAYGLAGLRIGYGVGEASIWRAVGSTAIPLSVTGVAEVAARASLAPEAQAESELRISELVARRDALVARLRTEGVPVPDAQGNFVWIPQEASGIDAEALAAAFAESGTLVRPFPGEGVRISVGEADSLAVVVDIVRQNLVTRSASLRGDVKGCV